MVRSFKVSIIGVIVLAAAQAGPILGPTQTQIGGTNGLTWSYIQTNGGNATVTNTLGNVVGTNSATTPKEAGYQATVFSGATGLTNPIPSGPTLTDSSNGVTFNLINDVPNGGGNAWQLMASPNSGATAQTITIPVGVFGVTDIWALADLYLAGSTAKDLSIMLNFGSTANVATTSVAIKPQNASAGTGFSEDAVVPTCPGTGCTGNAQGQTQGAVGPLSNNMGLAPTSDSGVGVGAIGGLSTADLQIYTDMLYTSAYSSINTGSTAGTVNLSDIGLVFGGGLLNFSEQNYLVSITIRDNSTTGTSGVFLSALTIDEVPEPGTIFLLLSGLGAFGFAEYRRRKRA